MDVYKLSPGFSPVFQISTLTDFERRTMKRPPYWNYTDGEEPTLYAICPACGNPITMVALARRTSDSPKAHGRHVTHDIPKLASYNQEAYDFCPYANPNAHMPDKNERKKNIDGLPFDIYNLLRKEFDRVIYLLQKDIPVYISHAFAGTLLDDYLKTKGYLYPAASLQNLPWTFAYASASHSLVKRFIKKESPLAQVLEQGVIPDCQLLEGKKPGYLLVESARKTFLDISFCFIAHERTVKDGVMSETIEFAVSSGNERPPRCIYRETIQINPTYFFNLVNLPPEKSKRNHELLALAAEKMLQYKGANFTFTI